MPARGYAPASPSRPRPRRRLALALDSSPRLGRLALDRIQAELCEERHEERGRRAPERARGAEALLVGVDRDDDGVEWNLIGRQ